MPGWAVCPPGLHRVDYQKLLIEHLDLVEKVVQFVARRHHLSASDTDEFASVVRFKLVDDNFAILRKFEARSALSTYLAIVVERLCLDFCVSKWGRWRPSASARRLGPVALLLEELVMRDGVTFDEAVGTLQTNHGVSDTREELHAMFVQLPRRPRPADYAPGGPFSMTPPPRTAIDEHDDRVALERVETALANAVASLPHEDRLMLRMRFDDGLTVPQIAEALGFDRKPLYRRLERVLDRLKSLLQDAGIEESDIARIVGHPALTIESLLVNDAAAAPARRAGRRR